jgi:hypothetical protein
VQSCEDQRARVFFAAIDFARTAAQVTVDSKRTTTGVQEVLQKEKWGNFLIKENNGKRELINYPVIEGML